MMRIEILFVFTGLLFLGMGCRPDVRGRVISETREMMGTLVHIEIQSQDALKAREAMDKAFERMKEVERVFSLWIPESEVCYLNDHAWKEPVHPPTYYGKDDKIDFEAHCPRYMTVSELQAKTGIGGGVKVSPWMKEVLETSLSISRETGGAFDVTVMPLAMLWKEKMKVGVIPDPKEIERLKPLVDYRSIRLDADGRVFFLKQEMKLDFGGIAKGFAVDQAVRVLREAGFRNFMVGASGDLYLSGEKSRRRWKIGIRHPRREGEFVKVLTLKDRAVSTSGDYEQYVDVGGRRYHHILDPRTGYPAQGSVSVTVVAPNSALADAYATALFVMGPEKAASLLRRHPKLEVFILIESERRLTEFRAGGRKDRIEFKGKI